MASTSSPGASNLADVASYRDVCVVVPARDAEHCVGAAVRGALGERDAAGGAPRVIVVDDGSLDRTGEVAREAGAEVIRGPGQGPARARNLGVAQAHEALIVFLDADCDPRPGFLRELLAPLADPRVGGVKGAYETEQRSWVARFVQVEYEERYARMERRKWIDFVDTYAAAYRRSVLEEVGGFDERYLLPSTEDQELSFRVVEAGHKLCFAPRARVGHLHAATFGGYVRKKFKIGRFKVATLTRHPAKAVDDSHTPESLKLQVLLAPLVPLGLPAAAFALTAVPLTLRVLRRDPPVALVAPALIYARALALGAGVLQGLCDELRGGVLLEGERPGEQVPA